MVAIKRLNSTDGGFKAALDALLAFEGAQDDRIEQTVANILADVKKRGDAAVIEYTNRFDRLSAKSMAELELSRAELEAALKGLPADRRAALEAAAARVRSYHEKQPLQGWQYEDADGTLLGQKITPLDRVGLYVPGGKAAYPSSVLMNAIPAHVAGVGELIMVVPTPDGEHNQLVLAAAALAGVSRVFCIGGAQAVGVELARGGLEEEAADVGEGVGRAVLALRGRGVRAVRPKAGVDADGLRRRSGEQGGDVGALRHPVADERVGRGRRVLGVLGVVGRVLGVVRGVFAVFGVHRVRVVGRDVVAAARARRQREQPRDPDHAAPPRARSCLSILPEPVRGSSGRKV